MRLCAPRGAQRTILRRKLAAEDGSKPRLVVEKKNERQERLVEGTCTGTIGGGVRVKWALVRSCSLVTMSKGGDWFQTDAQKGNSMETKPVVEPDG